MPLALLFALTFSLTNLSVLNVPMVEAAIMETPDPKSVWMDALAQCESQGSTTQKTWDTNNRWSIGKYQYQYLTWAKYSKMFGTTKGNITDGILQDAVTRYVLDHHGEDNWYTCSRIVKKSLGEYPSS